MSWGQSLQYPYPPIWWGILCMKCCTTRFNSFWWWPLLKFLYPPIWWDELYKLNCCTVCGCIENFGGGGTQLCWPMWGEKSCQCLLMLCHGCFFSSFVSLGHSCVWSIFLAWLATWVGVFDGTNFFEMFVHSSSPDFSSPRKNDLCSSFVQCVYLLRWTN